MMVVAVGGRGRRMRPHAKFWQWGFLAKRAGGYAIVVYKIKPEVNICIYLFISCAEN